MRTRARVDRNHTEVVKALRRCGARVLSLAAVGGGCPDLLVNLQGRLVLVEVKDGTKAQSRQAYTQAQVDFHRDWPVLTIRSVADVELLFQPPRQLSALAL